jgi:site-specific DNA-methyltransferase (adenine-specific)
MLELNKLYNMDCMEGMKQFPDKYFDLAVVDPPYGIGASNMKRGNSVIKPDKTKRWDDSPPTKEYFNELIRVSKQQIIWGGNYFDLPSTRCFLIWDKAESMYGRSFAECEFAWTSYDASARIYKLNPNDSCRIHPTQKPIKLYKWILKLFAQKGYKILDTHAGSCSSLIACIDMGLEYMGFEIDKEYYEAAAKRIENYKKQPSMFNELIEDKWEQQQIGT